MLQDKAGSTIGSSSTRSSSEAEMTVDYAAKTSILKTSILKNYADLGIEKVTGEAGNSGQTPPNGHAWGYWKDKDNV